MSKRNPHYHSAHDAWVNTLEYILDHGRNIGPRGLATTEVLDNCFSFDMIDPIIKSFARNLNYKFLCAEAEWITRGSNLVEDLTKYNSQMAKFSDDGVILSGAYGLPYMEQFDYVVNALVKDVNTRQAAMTIWSRNPASSKDIPCTVAMVFTIRDNRFDAHVFMRSSDAWLGLPYDIFSFTMMAMKILCEYNLRADHKSGAFITPGKMFLKLVSSHLYAEHIESAYSVIAEYNSQGRFIKKTPMPDFCWTNWEQVQGRMMSFMDSNVPKNTLFNFNFVNDDDCPF